LEELKEWPDALAKGIVLAIMESGEAVQKLPHDRQQWASG
jgi:hypothetical protein